MSDIVLRKSTETIRKAVNMSCYTTISAIVIYWISNLISMVVSYTSELSALVNAAFPVLFTLLTCIGATSSVTAMSPAAAVFTNIIVGLIPNVIVPLIIVFVVVSLTGSMYDGVRLDGVGVLIKDIINWIIRTMFFVFVTFLVVQGIFTGIKDGISLRVSKFALGKYVPIIGGYLSEGINYLVSGGIVIKNAVGLTSIILLLIKFLPIIISMALASLSLKFVCAVGEPVGAVSFVSALKKVDECISVLISLTFGITFVTIVFFGSIMLLGNTVI